MGISVRFCFFPFPFSDPLSCRWFYMRTFSGPVLRGYGSLRSEEEGKKVSVYENIFRGERRGVPSVLLWLPCLPCVSARISPRSLYCCPRQGPRGDTGVRCWPAGDSPLRSGPLGRGRESGSRPSCWSRAWACCSLSVGLSFLFCNIKE